MKSFKEFCQLPISKFHFAESVYSCQKQDSIKKVTEGMIFNNIGCVVVLDQNKPVGIFTERDLMKKVFMKLTNIESQSIEKVMTTNPVSVTMETPLVDVIHKMQDGRFRHLVIIKDDKTVASVISIKDVLDKVAQYLHQDQ